MATQACSVLRNVSPNPIKEDEIGYIAVSFALALERQKPKEWAPKNILIVCASGKGLSLIHIFLAQFNGLSILSTVIESS